jgi:histidinol-phosphate/aromatic aminotransferase/cobyric acid decarboxylase-like protein
MTFAEFQPVRDRLLRERRDLLDCAATNLYAPLARLVPPAAPPPAQTVHRCHLAAEWCAYFGFAPEYSRRALISAGVRDSLARLFAGYAAMGARLWLPADNYPVYGELARRAGLQPQEFDTLPDPLWPDNSPAGGPELLLVTNPLKPLGRWLSPADVAHLRAWLAADRARRVILDAVYTFERSFHPATRDLLASGQALLLHSLTKGWLHPRLFGVALVPEEDVPALSPLFRAAPPPQEDLARARELMAAQAAMPEQVAAELAGARARLAAALSPALAGAVAGSSPPGAPGYFTLVNARWTELLEDSRVLGLPATIFGSAHQDITILSSLSFLR